MKDAPPPPTRIFKVLKFYTLELPKIKIIPHTSDFFFGSTHVYVSNSFAALTHSVMQIEITTFLLIC